MRKTTTTLSALAVAATVSATMAQTKSALFYYCTAYEQVENSEGGIDTIVLEYNRELYSTTYHGPCTYMAAFYINPSGFYTTYGYLKTTGAGLPCDDFGSCPRIMAYQQF